MMIKKLNFFSVGVKRGKIQIFLFFLQFKPLFC